MNIEIKKNDQFQFNANGEMKTLTIETVTDKGVIYYFLNCGQSYKANINIMRSIKTTAKKINEYLVSNHWTKIN